MRGVRLGLAAVSLAVAGLLAGCLSEEPSPLAVKLDSYVISAPTTRVAEGRYEFRATNASATEVHELAVLRIQEDGTLKQLVEIEDLASGTAGTATLRLTKGTYVLACFIVPGEQGSKVDHYKAGMRQELIVG